MREPGLDVRRHTFTRTFRGFDEAEVDAVLQTVAVDFDETHATLRQLELALAEVTAEAEHLLQGERSVIRIMRSADEHARMCIGSAHRQAARIVEAAEEHAQTLLARAEDERAALVGEIHAIERRRAHVLSALGALVESMTATPAADALPTHDLLPMPPRAMDTTPDERRGEPVADDDGTGSPTSSSGGSEAHQSPLVSVGPAAVVPFPHAADPDTGVDDATEPVGDPAPDQEPIVSTRRRRLFAMSKRRAAMAAAAVLLSASAIAWPSVHGSRRAAVTGPPAPKGATTAVHDPDDDGLLTMPAATPAMPEPAPIVLALKSTRECWVRVTVDGVAEELMLAAGDELARSGKATIRLRIGDAAALSVEVNGHALAPLGPAGQVVDRTFTADNLPR